MKKLDAVISKLQDLRNEFEENSEDSNSELIQQALKLLRQINTQIVKKVVYYMIYTGYFGRYDGDDGNIHGKVVVRSFQEISDYFQTKFPQEIKNNTLYITDHNGKQIKYKKLNTIDFDKLKDAD